MIFDIYSVYQQIGNPQNSMAFHMPEAWDGEKEDEQENT